MTEWYYADAQRERHGPVDAGTIRDLFRKGELDLTTLVWREGMPQWQALSVAAEELELLVATPASEGIDLRADYTAIADGSAVAAATAAAADRDASPYAAPGTVSRDHTRVVHGGEVVYAGLWRRFAASIIDSFVTGMLSYVLLIPLMLVMGVSMASLSSGSDVASAGVMVTFYTLNYAISILVPALYFGWMYSTSNMASLGKMAVGIKVVRSNGDGLTFWRGFLRYIALMLFTLVTCGLGVLIAGLMVAFTERKQGVHDMICDTLVVDKWAFTDNPEWQQRGLGTVTIVVLSIFGLLAVLGIVAVLAVIGIASSNFN
ncbi:MAG: RDD family protein [Stenotrophomonas sp.]|uniref:RDD family protein n=1 Tax=Stenotrophomonas sp. TaxID=69392 RepID=UPI0028ACE5D8|nr:RDD family protein [Stenotrophomonas sp.]